MLAGDCPRDRSKPCRLFDMLTGCVHDEMRIGVKVEARRFAEEKKRGIPPPERKSMAWRCGVCRFPPFSLHASRSANAVGPEHFARWWAIECRGSGGAVTSNKEEATAKFLARKEQKGGLTDAQRQALGAHTRTYHVSCQGLHCTTLRAPTNRLYWLARGCGPALGIGMPERSSITLSNRDTRVLYH